MLVLNELFGQLWWGYVSNCLDWFAGKMKSYRHEGESFLIPDRSHKCCLGPWHHLSAFLLFSVGPSAPGFCAEPHSVKTNSPTLVPDYRLALNMPVRVSTLVLRTVAYYYAATIWSQRSGSVDVAQCQSESWLECPTSTLGDTMEGTTLANTCWVQTGCCTRPGWLQQYESQIGLLGSSRTLISPTCCTSVLMLLSRLQQSNYQDFNQDPPLYSEDCLVWIVIRIHLALAYFVFYL